MMMFSPDETPDEFYRVSVKALVSDDSGKLLLFQDKAGRWEIPGGGWERQEDMAACVTRELAEEVRAKVVEVGDVSFCYRGTTLKGYPKLCIAARVVVEPGKLTPSSDDLAVARYVSKNEFLLLPFQPGEETVKEFADTIWPVEK